MRQGYPIDMGGVAGSIPYLFLTTNSTYTPLDIVHKLNDIETATENVYTAAQAMAEFVVNQKSHMAHRIRDRREGRVMNFEMIERAHRPLAAGANLLSTNSDNWRPTDSGPAPAAETLEARPFMMRAAPKRIGLATDEVTWRGHRSGFKSILVLTG